MTSLWRLPSCFAAMLFCADTITRRRCGARSKVKGYRPIALIQLPVRVRVSNPIENFSTYVVSRRHIYTAYNDTSLQEHREVKRSRSTKCRFLERSNEVMEFSINIARSKGQGQTSFPAKMCLGTLKFHASRRTTFLTLISISFCLYCQTGSNREKPRKKVQTFNIQMGKL